MNFLLKTLAVFLTALLAAGNARGCGPWFPENYLAGNEGRVLAIPEGRFDVELARLLKLPEATYVERGLPDQGLQWGATLGADLADLKAALAAAGVDGARAEGLTREYEALRRAMKRAADGSEDDRYFGDKIKAPQRAAFDLAPCAVLLGALPEEFVLYVKGAAAWRANEATSAAAHFNALLALPPAQRQYRSTWAAFMLGKTALPTDPAGAAAAFERTRALASEGFRDSLGLAADSLGWQARAERAMGRPVEALRHYREQARGGARYSSSMSLSFRLVCEDIVTSLPLHLEVFKDTEARRIVNAWVVTRGYFRQIETWQKLLAESGTKLEPAEADQLAWLAYRSGKMDQAREWLGRTSARTPVGSWVQAKLLLREGKIDAGLKILKSLVPLLPQDEDWVGSEYYPTTPREDVQAEIGVLLLGRRDFLSAFDTFARSGYWEDTAYLAERVLTTIELEDYLKAHKDDEVLSATLTGDYGDKNVLEGLRYLLARRLARAGQWERARAWYPASMLGTFDDYVATLKAGRDPGRERRARADALFKAGMIVRQYGMELLGTEVDPDWTLYGGDYEREPFSVLRKMDRTTSLTRELGQAALAKALLASADEKKRIAARKVEPDKRFHYRYNASNLMWECARLLPDNDPLTAAALYHGGAWHKTRDEAFADKFYQALVRRCAKLPAGQEADRVRWFPATPPPTPELAIVKPEQRND